MKLKLVAKIAYTDGSFDEKVANWETTTPNDFVGQFDFENKPVERFIINIYPTV